MPEHTGPFRADALAPTTYAHGITLPADGRMILLAGMSPLDASGAVVAPGDVTEQMRVTVQNARTVLRHAGADLDAIVRARIYIASAERAELYAAWQAFTGIFDGSEFPSTLVGVTVLAYPDQLVEVEFDAIVPR
ncbi:MULTISPECIES: RidA family protein [unclassified Microbacterium]|uniref:RidA family protein n=1 Tax=unclassified Microbacterium TaxID=2609290 RepID=UPI00214CC723|nr:MULTISPECIES: RidA family protein [unclassified Microbacterium]MCR2809730.1 RidA family protein [Microbacterium sp. zg.B185]WIM17955.1 RidA family protein [Microbacterium sp. zg-B185]